MENAWLAMVALGLLLVPALASPGTGQTETLGSTSVDLSLPVLPRPVAPGDTQSFNVSVRYQWQNGFSPQDTTIRLEIVDEPPWLNSSFSPATIQVPIDGPRGLSSTLVGLSISLAPDAPAFEIGLATYRVVAEENGVLQRAEAEVNFEVTAGFSGQLEATMPKGPNVTAWGGFVTKVPIRMENRGNGELLVNLSVVRKPAEAQVHLPEDFRLGIAGEERVQVVDLEVLVPWKVSVEGLVEVEVRPSHLERGTPGAVLEVAFQLDGRSAVPVPGPGPMVVLAAVAGAVLVAGRWRARPQ